MRKYFYFLIIFVFFFSCSETETGHEKNNRPFTTSENGVSFLKEKEGFSEYAYTDGTYTIGYGNTYYTDGTAVKKGDKITRAQAEQILKNVLKKDFERGVNNLVTSNINQCQFDALVSYSYNRGLGAFKKSEVLKAVNKNPNNPDIRKIFVSDWGKNTRYKNGLIRRRKLEAEMYFSCKETTEQEKGFKFNFYKILSIILLCITLFLTYTIRQKQHGKK
jgi:lysozyme